MWQGLRFALRQLRKSPVFALVAVLTLALGIGANTAIFSLINGALLKPLPYPHAERLVQLFQPFRNFDRQLERAEKTRDSSLSRATGPGARN